MRTLCYLCLLCGMMACSKIDLTEEPTVPNTSTVVVKDTLTVSMLADKDIGEMVGVKGYLVGYCMGTSLKAASNEIPEEANTNFLLSDTPTLEGATTLTAVGLNKSNVFHEAWNLAKNPERLGKYLFVYGKLQTYFGIKGIRDPKKIELLPFPLSEPQEHEDSTSISKNDTITPLQFLALEINQFVTLRGYIVGTLGGSLLSSAVVGKAKKPATNLLLATTPTETDVAKMVPVRLKDKSEERIVLDLYAHPNLLGQRLTVSGVVTTYFGVNGITNIVSYRLDTLSKATPIDPVPSDSTRPPQPQNPPTISDSTAVIDGRAPSWRAISRQASMTRRRE